MPRPARILRTATTALCLALFTLAAAFWIRSQFAVDRWVWGTPPRAYHVRSQVGFVDFEYANIPLPARAAYGAFHLPITRQLTRQILASDRPRALAYRSEHLQLPAAGLRPAITADTHVLSLCYWLICLLTALAPAAHLLTYVRHRRLRQRATANLCPTCNYDLRATPARCPECGATIAPIAPPTPTV